MGKKNAQKEYAKLRLRLSAQKIRAAKILYDNSEFRDAVSRAYYSIFYAAKALLLREGQDPSSHKGVDTLFHKFCLTHNRPSADFARMLSLMRQARLNADYREKARITQEDAREAIAMAKSFLKEIRSLIK
jgi:uncharacterized protein (UPF0332 family)